MCFFFKKKNDPEKMKILYGLSDIQYNTLRNAGINDIDIEHVCLIEDIKSDRLYTCLLQIKEKINIQKRKKKKNNINLIIFV